MISDPLKEAPSENNNTCITFIKCLCDYPREHSGATNSLSINSTNNPKSTLKQCNNLVEIPNNFKLPAYIPNGKFISSDWATVELQKRCCHITVTISDLDVIMDLQKMHITVFRFPLYYHLSDFFKSNLFFSKSIIPKTAAPQQSKKNLLKDFAKAFVVKHKRRSKWKSFHKVPTSIFLFFFHFFFTFFTLKTFLLFKLLLFT